MRSIILVVHDVRSAYNVGSLLRTADGLGVEEVYLTGYTPYPAAPKDSRLPHVAAKTSHQIAKTALGAEQSVNWQHEPDVNAAVDDLKTRGYEIVALEQAPKGIPLNDFEPPAKVALIVGNEVNGLSSEILALSSKIVMIPMSGKKESFNVAIAAAIALYHLRVF